MWRNSYRMLPFSFGRPPYTPLSDWPIWFHRGSTIYIRSKFFENFLKNFSKGFSLVLVLLFASPALSASCPNRMTITVPPGAIVNQPDGDTFHIFTFGVPNRVEIRVDGVNTPERPTKKTPSPGWLPAKEFTKAWLAKGPLTVTTCGERTMSRIVATVERDGHTLAEALIAAGFGRP